MPGWAGGKCNSLVNNDNAFVISSGTQETSTFVIERNDSSNQENLLGATLFQHSKQKSIRKLVIVVEVESREM
jgi:hypothetical protein